VADFTREDLRGSRFERVDLSGSEFRASDLTETRFRGVEMSRVVMRGVGLFDVDIHGEIGNLTINGVDIGPLVNAELDRRYPDRAKMRPTDPAGFRDAWDVVERFSEPVEGPGWPKSRRYPVRECLLCILNEEWEHLLYAERDLNALEARAF
jgi:hypothetical protein